MIPEVRLLLVACAMVALLPASWSSADVVSRPCVAGVQSPTPESGLSLVSTDPGSNATQSIGLFNLDYPHRQGELLVFPRRTGPALEEERVKWASLWQAVGAEVMRFDGAVPLYEIKLPLEAALQPVADQLLRDGHELIASIEANSCVFPQQQGGTLDPDSVDQWGHRKIGLEQAWMTTTGSSSVVVAIVDSGINHQNPDLACNFWVNPCDTDNGIDDECPAHAANGLVDDLHGWNFWSNNNQLYDNAHHGTMIAGIVGACHNLISVVGVNWSVSMMDLRVYDTVGGTGSLGFALSAIAYAIQNGAQVINASWTTAPTSKLYDLIRSSPDVIVTTAAGEHWPDGLELVGTHTVYPCNWVLPNLICATSSTEKDEKEQSADFGAVVHIAAPGEKIRTTDDIDIGMGSGTSFAAPYVAGVVALVKTQFPLASTDEVVRRVLCGDDLPALAGKTKPGKTPGTGRRLNASKALGAECAAAPSPSEPLR